MSGASLDVCCVPEPKLVASSAGVGTYRGGVRDVDAIDMDLRVLRAVLWSIRKHGGAPSAERIDALLDERLDACAGFRGQSMRDTPLTDE